MTRDEIRQVVIARLRRRRAGGRPGHARSARAAARQLDLDSMDFLNFVVGLHAALGVDIPEADYAKLATLDGCVEYLAARRGE